MRLAVVENGGSKYECQNVKPAKANLQARSLLNVRRTRCHALSCAYDCDLPFLFSSRARVRTCASVHVRVRSFDFELHKGFLSFHCPGFRGSSGLHFLIIFRSIFNGFLHSAGTGRTCACPYIGRTCACPYIGRTCACPYIGKTVTFPAEKGAGPFAVYCSLCPPSSKRLS